MRIVANENITYVREAFNVLGGLSVFRGRSLTPENVRDADVLIVRSVTRVNQSLLRGSQVKYVGTATSGLDHIDVSYLAQNDIGFSHAQGANAQSVADYVMAALLAATASRSANLAEMTCGIVGYGHVGSNVYQRLTALGVQCSVYDPPLAQESKDDFFCDWDSIVECEAITFHTPLSEEDPYLTRHMVNDDFMNAIAPATILINTSRGEVMDTQALIDAKIENPDLFYVFDVWENEPNINLNLFELTDIATSHIAGYSWDGKIAGTRQIFDGLCKHLVRDSQWPEPHPPSPVSLDIRIDSDGRDSFNGLREIVRHAYPISDDDQRLRAAMAHNSGSPGIAFDRLRRDYWTRREFSAYRVDSSAIGAETEQYCEALGFKLV
ncbi:MAG: 4-phosphoerythronate dehydrogenase [Candidatus Hydrogenedentota bacterium]